MELAAVERLGTFPRAGQMRKTTMFCSVRLPLK